MSTLSHCVNIVAFHHHCHIVSSFSNYVIIVTLCHFVTFHYHCHIQSSLSHCAILSHSIIIVTLPYCHIPSSLSNCVNIVTLCHHCTFHRHCHSQHELSTGKKESVEVNQCLDEITERWKKLTVEVTSVQTMLEEVVTYWRRYTACVDILTVWLADAEKLLDTPPQERGVSVFSPSPPVSASFSQPHLPAYQLLYLVI